MRRATRPGKHGGSRWLVGVATAPLTLEPTFRTSPC